MITRRTVLKGIAAAGLSGIGLGTYAFGIEPRYRLAVTYYRIQPPGWTPGLHVRFAIIADPHVGEPYLPPDRLADIVQQTNALGADAILLLGDYASSIAWQSRHVPPHEWATVLGGLRAPLGVHAVLGNHDWWDDREAQRRRAGPVVGRIALESAGIPVYENDVVRLEKAGRAFWLAGLGDQIAFPTRTARGWRRFVGVHDLPRTLAKIRDNSPVILMAHEPDIFPTVPARVALTISGHTHGGQLRVLGYSPYVPSMYGNRFAYGHVVEGGRHLVVSGGLGCSGLPVRFGVPPEIVLIEVGTAVPSASHPSVSRV